VKEQSLYIKKLKKEKTKAARKLLIDEIGINEFMEDQFRRMFSSFALSMKNKYNRQGALFQRRMKRVQVEEESKLVYLINYVHYNPIHHGLCINIDEWPYSSYTGYAQGKINDFQIQYIKWLSDGNFIEGLNIFIRSLNEFKTDYKSVKHLEED
jgi:hypothetical protein